MFLVVGSKMLDGHTHVSGLGALNQGNRKLGSQVRVLAHVFEVASAQRGALDVDGGPQVDTHLFVLALIPDGFPDLPHQFPVKAGGAGTGCRETDSLDAFVDAQVVRLVILLAQAVGAV